MTSEIVSGDLVNLAEQIRAEHQSCLQSMRQGMEHALKVGELLLQAKDLVKHGEWLDWVETNCGFTPRMARNYMRVARGLPFLKTETISEMTLKDALNRVDFETRKLTGGGSYIRKRKERAKKWKLELEDNQVKHYLDAVKGFRNEIRQAVDVAEFGKFSPEGIRFTIRRHEELRLELEKLEDVFQKKLHEKEGAD